MQLDLTFQLGLPGQDSGGVKGLQRGAAPHLEMGVYGSLWGGKGQSPLLPGQHEC